MLSYIKDESAQASEPCIKGCLPGTVEENGICKNCHPNCKTCNKPNDHTACLSCEKPKIAEMIASYGGGMTTQCVY